MGVKRIHHITALASDPQTNVDFYTSVLGLRLVKVSVNQDDVNVYHFFYADASGSPGTDITFFPYPGLARGVLGYGVASRVHFAITPEALGFWVERLKTMGVHLEKPRETSEGIVMNFRDPDGLELSLIASDEVEEWQVDPWTRGGIPEEYFIRGFYGVSITVASCRRSGFFLEDILGLRRVYGAENLEVYEAEGRGPGRYVIVECPTGLARGYVGSGVVHHVAFAVESEEEQLHIRRELERRGFKVTPVIDRKWFKSIYFREPGGVLYEVATEGPGFTVDEPYDMLGTSLKLPEWLEPYRESIVKLLPRVRLPTGRYVP